MSTTVNKSFSLPSEVAEYLETLPNREQSKFVSAHLSRAVEYHKKMKAMEKLRNFPRVKGSSGESSTETLRKVRKEASERLDNRIK